MTSALLDGVQHGLTTAPLEFTRWLNDALVDTMNRPTKPDPATDPMSAYKYLRGRRDAIEGAARQRPMLRLFDKNMDPIAQIAGERLGRSRR
ncbi:Bacteriophage protein [Mycobacteroides abscessus]|nr:hypothetical protein [Mycobacteroides abscessus]CQA10966.1 Bacteriophage protein [Mycobacteroides abscessus]